MRLVTVFLSSLLLASPAVLADNYRSPAHAPSHVQRPEVFFVDARVISATPIYESYWYYRSRGDNSNQGHYNEVCRIREIDVYEQGRGNGAAGAVIGGVIGSHIGASTGRDRESAVVGAIAGGVIGGVIGSEIDRSTTTTHRRIERECDYYYQHERRELIGYEVRYRYNGRDFTMQTAQHPGRYVQLRIEVQPSLRY